MHLARITFVSCLALGAVKANSTMIFTGGEVMAIASQGSVPGSTDFEGVSPPLAHNVVTAHAGGSTAVTTADFASVGGFGSLNWTFHHATDASSGSIARSYVQEHFSVDADMQYTLSGQYDFSAGDAEARLLAYMRDETAGVDLSFEFHQSNPHGAGSFAVGQSGGNQVDWISAVTGTLLAGHSYYMELDDRVFSGATSGIVTGSGYLSLTAGPAAPAVPEPSTLSMLGLGMLGVIRLARRRKV